jgi:hypothetical protein
LIGPLLPSLPCASRRSSAREAHRDVHRARVAVQGRGAEAAAAVLQFLGGQGGDLSRLKLGKMVEMEEFIGNNGGNSVDFSSDSSCFEWIYDESMNQLVNQNHD